MPDSASVYIIETVQDLERLAAILQRAPRVAVDLESDGFFTYHSKVCLIQLSTETDNFIVDPLAVKDMSPLGPVFRNSEIEKVFHAAEYDIQCLKRDFGFEVDNLFDTMVAARLLGARELGLAALILKHFGIKLSKKLQRSDWGKRPLTPEHIEYAASDTHYLLALRDILDAQLKEKDRWPDARDAFERVVALEPPEKEFDPDGFWRLRGARALTGEGRAVLKEIYFYREKTAAETNRAPFRVLPEALMVTVARHLPRDLESLERTPGMTPYLFKKFGPDILAAVLRGLEQPPIDQPPKRSAGPPPDVSTLRRYQAIREWRKRKAEELDLDSAVILTPDEIRNLSRAPADNPDSAGWLSCLSERKRQLYGAELLPLLNVPPPVPGRRRRGRRKPSL